MGQSDVSPPLSTMTLSAAVSEADEAVSGYPLVTVITPAYNRADYLDEVIRSVLDQDYPNLEYIVLDDGSTDGTPEIVQRYAHRVVAVSHPNMGETRTVNVGLRMATGEIVGIVNSDDPILPGAIRAVVDALEGDSRLAAVYPDWNMIDADGTVIQHIRTYEYSYIDMLRRHHCTPGPGAFFRREIAERLNGRDPQFRYIADFDFWLRAGLLGPFRRIPQTLATFRWHEGGASSYALGSAMAEEHIRLADKIFGLPALPVAVRKVRREAFSSANYIAADVMGGRPSIQKEMYFLKALAFSPEKYVFEYRGRLLVIVREFMGILVRMPKAVLRRARKTDGTT